MDKLFITSYCIIKKGFIQTNDQRLVLEDYADDGKFLKQVYKQLQKPYAKFYKMDRLCKLAYLNAEFLLDKVDLKKYKPDEVALVFSNANSSINTDIKHNASIVDRNNYFPEPATFVYTLPNIVLGEISIRHQIRGENVFFVTEKFDYEFIVRYTLDLLNNSRHKACIIGRTDYTSEDMFSSMFFVEFEDCHKQDKILTPENIKMIIEG